MAQDPVRYHLDELELTEYNANNYKIDETDGWRRVGPAALRTSPRPSTTPTTTRPTTPTATRTRGRRSPSTVYNTNNTTIDETDGYRRVGSGALRTSPRPSTTPTTTRPTTPTATRTVVAGHHRRSTTRTTRRSTSPTGIAGSVPGPCEHHQGRLRRQQLQGRQHRRLPGLVDDDHYDGIQHDNTTNDDTDGYRRVTNGGFSGSITKAIYDANNTTQDSSDGFRRINPSGAWVSITEAEYNARNTDERRNRRCPPGSRRASPYRRLHGPSSHVLRHANAEILARLISGNFNGVSRGLAR